MDIRRTSFASPNLRFDPYFANGNVPRPRGELMERPPTTGCFRMSPSQTHRLYARGQNLASNEPPNRHPLRSFMFGISGNLENAVLFAQTLAKDLCNRNLPLNCLNVPCYPYNTGSANQLKHSELSLLINAFSLSSTGSIIGTAFVRHRA